MKDQKMIQHIEPPHCLRLKIWTKLTFRKLFFGIGFTLLARVNVETEQLFAKALSYQGLKPDSQQGNKI